MNQSRIFVTLVVLLQWLAFGVEGDGTNDCTVEFQTTPSIQVATIVFQPNGDTCSGLDSSQGLSDAMTDFVQTQDAVPFVPKQVNSLPFRPISINFKGTYVSNPDVIAAFLKVWSQVVWRQVEQTYGEISDLVFRPAPLVSKRFPTIRVFAGESELAKFVEVATQFVNFGRQLVSDSVPILHRLSIVHPTYKLHVFFSLHRCDTYEKFWEVAVKKKPLALLQEERANFYSTLDPTHWQTTLGKIVKGNALSHGSDNGVVWYTVKYTLRAYQAIEALTPSFHSPAGFTSALKTGSYHMTYGRRPPKAD